MNQFPKDNAALAKLLRTMNQVPKGLYMDRRIPRIQVYYVSASPSTLRHNIANFFLSVNNCMRLIALLKLNWHLLSVVVCVALSFLNS
uniref:Uncharacterized protein n=1 Tax=Manihot esculenta TaxID=3983 RepID=A0A2C9W2N2_MANES